LTSKDKTCSPSKVLEDNNNNNGRYMKYSIYKPGGGVLPIIDYMGMLLIKRVPFSGQRYRKGIPFFFRLVECKMGTFSEKGM